MSVESATTMDRKPTVLELVDSLRTLTKWTNFAQNLPGIEEYHIDKINAENKDDIDAQKRALFKNWLAIYSRATFRNVISALEASQNGALAESISEKLKREGGASGGMDMKHKKGSNGTTQSSTAIEETDSNEQLGSIAAGERREMDQQTASEPEPPDVSELFPVVQDIDKKIEKNYLTQLTQKWKEFIQKVNLILVTATATEYRAVMGATDPPEPGGKYIRVITEDHKSKNSANFILGKFGPCNVAITKTGQGPNETDKVLTLVQNAVKAEHVIAIGICYGAKESKTKELSDKTNLGDIIVSKSIADTSSKREEGPEKIIKIDTYDCGLKLLTLFRHDESFELKSKPVKVHVGVMASEDTLFRSEEEKQKIFKYAPHALGGEMEANGINRVAKREGGFEWIVVKSIVDWGNEDKNKNWQPFGAVSCAQFVLKCLKDHPDPLREQ